MTDYPILDDNGDIQEVCFEDYVIWHVKADGYGNDKRTIAYDKVGLYEVSTVFLEYSPGYLFETVIARRQTRTFHMVYRKHYQTKDEAITGHQKAVAAATRLRDDPENYLLDGNCLYCDQPVIVEYTSGNKKMTRCAVCKVHYGTEGEIGMRYRSECIITMHTNKHPRIYIEEVDLSGQPKDVK